MKLNDVTDVRKEVLFQKSFYVHSAAAELLSVNIVHYQGIGGLVSLVHRQTAEVIQVQTQVFSKVSDFVNVPHAEFQFEGFHDEFRDVLLIGPG
ncbi:hypothetical protein [Bradyrhizobium sp. 1(2017)]|uniref:hypothetical protein n=1 Tax=Bradyrhizobium sp. 1(2017) TaxID=1404888 RepID=UPI00140EE56E|nr:hypothetical protein [Bradyrhizobium sp. 1(2017)]QIO35390.1 hypothetical protein HAP40_28060 [Bradyrhizobium sp. 1(2017)]